MEKTETYTVTLKQRGKGVLSDYFWEAEIRNGHLIELRSVYKDYRFEKHIIPSPCLSDDKMKAYLEQLRDFITKVLKEIKRR